MKLTTTTFISVDGVIQGIGGPDEDRRGGFERGGWTTPLWDGDAGSYVTGVYERADAFLFGRWTYDAFAASWGAVEDPGMNPIASALHTKPKYVVSNSMADPQWARTTVLSGDPTSGVARLKETEEGELVVPGSGALVRSLLDAGLVDEMNLIVFPAVVGQGSRLFPDNGPDIALEILQSHTTSGGITIQVYRPAGRLRYDTSTADLTHMA